MKEIICAICGKKIKGLGNSCWPIFNEESYRCCDACNLTVVIPERIWEAQQAASKVEDQETKVNND